MSNNRKRWQWIVCASLMALGIVQVVRAADGDLDLTFGVNGEVVTDFGDPRDHPTGLVIDGSGRPVVAGAALVSGISSVALARYTTAGALDATFGTNGRVVTTIGTAGAAATDVTIDHHGKIVIVGLSLVGHPVGDVIYYSPDFAVARYNEDGSLDTTFGTGGIVTQDMGLNARAMRVAIDANNKIVLAGYSSTTKWTMTVLRYNEDGSLDSSFANGGIAQTIVGADTGGQGYALAIDSSNRIVVAGVAYKSGGETDFALVRYNENGTLDSSFGSSGIVIADVAVGEAANAVAIDSSGRIVAAGFGSSAADQQPDFVVARFASDGTLDTSFNGTGVVSTDFGGNDSAVAVRTLASAKILVAGWTLNGGGDFALVRYNADGSLDATFGSGGTVTTDFGGDDRGVALAVAANGAAFVAGESSVQSGDNWYDRFALARYKATPPPPADVFVTEGVDKPNTVNQGDALTYTITVANLGPNSGKNVVATDTLSSSTTFVSATTNKGNVTGPPAGQSGTITWQLGDIASGSTTQGTLSVTVIVRGKTTIVNTATVTADSPDPTPSNNTVSITTKVGAGRGNR
jgi:uncharacterized delta-60 repeat protein/uncharacterized repeat protein (TIGR01451 family)